MSGSSFTRRSFLRTSVAIGVAGALTGTTAAGRVDVDLDGSENPWPDRRVLNIAHAGGTHEAPEDTLFAMKRAVDRGTAMLEFDVHPAADGTPVLMHDTAVDRTTDGRGRVDEHSVEELKELDAAYWYADGEGTTHDADEKDYVYRGYATGNRNLPGGLGRRHGFEIDRNDFRVPTLEEVLQAFPDTYLLAEIKTDERTVPYESEVVDLLRAYDRGDDVIVASFDDTALERFKVQAPEYHTSKPLGRTGAYWASSQGPAPGVRQPRYSALHVPLTYEGVQVVDREFVEGAHEDGYAVHVWTINDVDEMEWLLDIGVDGIMTDVPTILADVLESRGLSYE